MSDPPAPETVYLVDGYAEIFRAFYAIRRPLHSPITGEPTGAVLVFAQMWLKLLALKPDKIVFVLDAPGGSFRDELHRQYHAPGETAPAPLVGDPGAPDDTAAPEPPGYKGTRRETPSALFAQVPRIVELVDLCAVPVIAVAGLEADDVIATLANRFVQSAEPGKPRHVRIVSPDKDLEQMIQNTGDVRVTLFDVRTGTDTDADTVWQKRGVSPEQIADYLALVGDAVDNIPGVPGIGSRTAAKLLARYGSLDGIRDSLPAIEARWREPLAHAFATGLPLSRRLTGLVRDARFAFDLTGANRAPDAGLPEAELGAFFDALGLNRLKAAVGA